MFHQPFSLKHVATILFAFTFISLQAQTLKSPDEFLPHKWGETYTPHHILESYFRHVVQNAPEQVKLIEYGKTIEGRPLLLAIVSSKENMANLEQIRKNNLGYVGFEGYSKPNNASPIAFVWLSCSVHGNEPSGSESSMKTIYELVNPNNKDAQTWMKNTVVLIDASVNPDGYSRYTNWFRQIGNTIPDDNPIAREHTEPWPGGRVNHYYFDLNRDWAWLSQPESQQRIKIYKEWMPHVVADLHEMGHTEPYYFAPAAQPYHKLITGWQRDFQVNIGKNNAKYFDKYGWLYFTKEIFDLFYPSYGDTYPTYNGAIGMTYEQGGGPRGGRNIKLPNNDSLTLKDRVLHQHTTSMATIEVSSQNASELVKQFSKYFESPPNGLYKSYVFKASNNKDKLLKFCNLLDAHKIKYGTVGASASITGFHFLNGKDQSGSVEAGDLVISTNQPMSVLCQTLLDPDHALVDSATYDITAWSLPFAYHLDGFALKQNINPDKKFDANYQSTMTSATEAYAYTANWQSTNNVRFLSQLLKNGVKVRVAEENSMFGKVSVTSGTLVITRADNRSLGKNLDAIVFEAAKDNRQEINALTTGFADQGRDIGSSHTRLLDKPKIALVWDDDSDENALGHIWSFLEREIQYPVTIIKTKQISRLDHNFNVVILPNGYYSLEQGTFDKLKSWMQDGGNVIALENAISNFEDKPGFSIAKFGDKKEKEDFDALKEKHDTRLQPYSCNERCSISDYNPGAIIKTTIDNSHPLGFGLGTNYFSLKTNNVLYSYLKDGSNVGYTDSNPRIIGFVGSRLKAQMGQKGLISTQNIGRGNIIYLSDNPVFRGFWYQGSLLLSNAIFMMP